MSPRQIVTIRARRWLIGAVLVAMFAMPIAAYKVGTNVNDNCDSIHKLVTAGSNILDSPKNLKDAYEDRAITYEQYREALAQVHRFDPLRERNLRIWRSADCE